MARLALACLTLMALMLWADAPPKKPAPKLWAGLGVTTPVIDADAVTDGAFFSVSLSLVNDGPTAVNPEVNDSTFLVNGKELKDWVHIIRNGPRGKDFESLPPGEPLRFGSAMGRHFT